MRLSFCTVCKGRVQHLRQAYRGNIEAGLAEGGDVEYVLLNADSPDDMHEWVMDALREYMRDGVLVYYRATGAIPIYSIPAADNTAMRLATGDAVSNLMADNLITTAYVREVRAILSGERAGRPLACAPSQCDRGTTGRASLFKQDFLRLGGYDERMRNWGYQDIDLVRRARASGMAIRPWTRETAGSVIAHSDAERTRFQQAPSEPPARSDARNKALSGQALGSRQLEANVRQAWGVWPMGRIVV
jgi:hypothetical protein